MAKILIAEDEPKILQILSEIVELTGHVPIRCRNGRVALDILADNRDVAMLITDIVMPEMDGRELIRWIRKDPFFFRLPVLIISGAVGPKEISNLLESGATAFLAKPVKMDALKDYIGRYLV